MAWTPITWQDLINTIAAPDSNDLTKNAGVSGDWDADARSVQELASAAAGAGIRFEIMPALAGATGVGLSSSNPTPHWDTIDYCILQWAGDTPTLQIYELGVLVFDSGGMTYELYEISINALGQIEYRELQTNTLLYTSLAPPSFPLFVDCSLDIYGWRINDVLIETGVVPPPAKIDHLMMMGVH